MLISVHKSSDTAPFLACFCKAYNVDINNNLIIELEPPYRTDGSETPNNLIINEENWSWVNLIDEEYGVSILKNLQNIS